MLMGAMSQSTASCALSTMNDMQVMIYQVGDFHSKLMQDVLFVVDNSSLFQGRINEATTRYICFYFPIGQLIGGTPHPLVYIMECDGVALPLVYRGVVRAWGIACMQDDVWLALQWWKA